LLALKLEIRDGLIFAPVGTQGGQDARAPSMKGLNE
jgi:hypothetical protein